MSRIIVMLNDITLGVCIDFIEAKQEIPGLKVLKRGITPVCNDSYRKNQRPRFCSALNGCSVVSVHVGVKGKCHIVDTAQ